MAKLIRFIAAPLRRLARGGEGLARSGLRREAFAFDSSKTDAWFALRNTLGAAAATALGFYLQGAAAATVSGVGALVVSYSDGHDSYLLRARRMFLSSSLCAGAVFLGAVAVDDRWFVGAIAVLWAFIAGLLVAVSSTASDIALFSLTVFVIFAVRHLGVHDAAVLAGVGFMGGAIQTIFSVVMWPLRPASPELRELGRLYSELGEISSRPTRSKDAPLGSDAITRAQVNLRIGLAGRRGRMADRCRSLLSQAERIRLRLISLSRMRRRLGAGAPAALEIETFLNFASQTLSAIGRALLAESGARAAACTTDVRALLRDLGEFVSTFESQISGSQAGAHKYDDSADRRRQMKSSFGQLRAAAQLMNSLSHEGAVRGRKLERARPWRLQYFGRLATLRANLTTRSTAFRHAVRLAAAIGIGEALAAKLKFPRTYWVPMTIALILRPEYGATLSRGVLRVGGTLLGLALTTLLYYFLPATVAVESTLAILFIFVVRWIGGTNYGVSAFGLSGLVVSLLGLTGVDPQAAIFARGANTAIGGGVALLIFLLWPTWERTQALEILARAIDSYRLYFAAVVKASALRFQEGFEVAAEFSDPDLDQARLDGRTARSNFEASLARLQAEPRALETQIAYLGAMMAATNRFSHASMALESIGSISAHECAQLKKFARDVDATLVRLRETLRSGAVARSEDFPDLRRSFTTLFGERSSELRLAEGGVADEADRIVNALNTAVEKSIDAVANATFATRKEGRSFGKRSLTASV